MKYARTRIASRVVSNYKKIHRLLLLFVIYVIHFVYRSKVLYKFAWTPQLAGSQRVWWSIPSECECKPQMRACFDMRYLINAGDRVVVWKVNHSCLTTRQTKCLLSHTSHSPLVVFASKAWLPIQTLVSSFIVDHSKTANRG